MARAYLSLRRYLAPAIRRLTHQLGISTLLLRAAWPRILMYHGVEPDMASTFREQMEFLSKHCSVVSLETLLSRHANHTCRNELALTFDDGLRNNHQVVYPILKTLNLPATFFVCPRNTTQGQWISSYDIFTRLQLLPLPERLGIAQTLSAPDPGPAELLGFLKHLPHADRLSAENYVRMRSSFFQPSLAQRSQFDVMNWDELASLDPALITIGSHSMSHPNLTSLTAAQLAFEVHDSKHLLEERLGRAVKYFCYPDGFYDQAVVESVRAAYRGAVTVNWGVLRVDSDPHTLPRVPMDPADVHLFAWRLHRA